MIVIINHDFDHDFEMKFYKQTIRMDMNESGRRFSLRIRAKKLKQDKNEPAKRSRVDNFKQKNETDNQQNVTGDKNEITSLNGPSKPNDGFDDVIYLSDSDTSEDKEDSESAVDPDRSENDNATKEKQAETNDQNDSETDVESSVIYISDDDDDENHDSDDKLSD